MISLRDGDKVNDMEEEKYLALGTDVKFVRIPPRAWWASDGSIPAEIGLAEFRKVMADEVNYPVLVHCFAGIHRTGAFCAVRRMDHDGWTNQDAIKEMRSAGLYRRAHGRSSLSAPLSSASCIPVSNACRFPSRLPAKNACPLTRGFILR